MADRFNTIAGWTLGAGIVALGLTSISSHYFRADKDQRPAKMGYEIAGVVKSGEGGAGAAPVKVMPGDAAKGAEVFKKCGSCHVLNGANGIGPALAHVVGDAIGKGRGGFAFSDDLVKKGGKWDEASLDKWLANPREFAAGTKMSFAGLDSAQDRADVIAYLKAN